MLGAFVTLKFNLQYYGAEQFGLYILLLSAWNFGLVFDFGLNTAIIRKVAEFNAQKDHGSLKASVLISLALYFSIACGILFLIYSLISLIYLSADSIIPGSLKTEARVLSLILGMNFFFQYLSNLFKAVYDGLEKFIVYSQVIITYNVVLIISNLTVVFLNGSLIEFAYTVFFTSCFLFIVQFSIFLFNFRSVKSKFDISRSFLNAGIFKFGFNMQISTILVSLIDPVIKYLIGNFLTIYNVSLYEIARRVSIAISGLFFNMYRTILPKVSTLSTYEEQRKYLTQDIMSFSRIGLLYSVLMFGLAILPLSFIIKTWFGNDTILVLMIILALPESVNNIGYPLYNFFIGIGKVKFLSAMQFVNITIISSSLALSLSLSKSIYGLLGYFGTVLIVNLIMVRYINSLMKTTFTMWIHTLGGYKILLFYVAFFIALYLAAVKTINLYLPFLVISGSSFALFYRELYEYGTGIINNHRQRNDT